MKNQMARYSKDSYAQIFDALLDQELYFTSSAATESNIKAAMKKVLGNAIKNGYISRYFDLSLDAELNVLFQIQDSDGDVFSIKLIYGA